jgi:hypothetical protein
VLCFNAVRLTARAWVRAVPGALYEELLEKLLAHTDTSQLRFVGGAPGIERKCRFPIY